MKKATTKWVLLCAVLLGPVLSMAQETEKVESDKVKIRIETSENGKKKVVEKEIDTTGMTAEEKQELIDSYTNDAMKGIKKSKKMKVIISDENSVFEDEDRYSFDFDEDEDFSWNEQNDGRPEVHIYKKKMRKGSDLGQGLDRFEDTMRYLGEEIPRRIERNFPRIYTWDNGLFITDGESTVQSLDVFPNRPSNNLVNVRFYVPKAGDVTITVLDIDGNVVGKDKVKNFEGEFAGQVKIDGKAEGTFFVIVSQGEDGITRKVKID
jgi:hypothetical protein